VAQHRGRVESRLFEERAGIEPQLLAEDLTLPEVEPGQDRRYRRTLLSCSSPFTG
jgi:hypothetical protein